MSDLRAACKHGRYEKHTTGWNNDVKEWCDGGWEVTIDYEAMLQWDDALWDVLALAAWRAAVADVTRAVISAAPARHSCRTRS